MQAGHGTLGGDGVGQGFEVRVILDTPLPDYEGRSLEGPCTTPPPSTCPPIVGDFNVFTTYTWVCHGSFAGSSFNGTRTRTQSVVEGQRCRPTLSAPVKRNSLIDNNSIFYVRSVVDSELVAPGTPELALELEGEGTIFANGLQIVFKEYGLVHGEIGGVPGRCSTRATAVWTR